QFHSRRRRRDSYGSEGPAPDAGAGPPGQSSRLLRDGEGLPGRGRPREEPGGGVAGGQMVSAGAELLSLQRAGPLATLQGDDADLDRAGLDGDLAGRGAAELRLDLDGQVLALLVPGLDPGGGQLQRGGRRLSDGERLAGGDGAAIGDVAAVARGEVVGTGAELGSAQRAAAVSRGKGDGAH